MHLGVTGIERVNLTTLFVASLDNQSSVQHPFLTNFQTTALIPYSYTVEPVLNRHSQKDHKLVFKTNYRLMQVESIGEWEHSSILLTFIKLPFVIKTFVLSIFEWPFYTDFTVLHQGIRRNFVV